MSYSKKKKKSNHQRSITLDLRWQKKEVVNLKNESLLLLLKILQKAKEKKKKKSKIPVGHHQIHQHRYMKVPKLEEIEKKTSKICKEIKFKAFQI